MRATKNEEAFQVVLVVGETLTKLVNSVVKQVYAALQKAPGLSDVALSIHIPPKLQ
jgi:hypothetical protein